MYNLWTNTRTALSEVYVNTQFIFQVKPKIVQTLGGFEEDDDDNDESKLSNTCGPWSNLHVSLTTNPPNLADSVNETHKHGETLLGKVDEDGTNIDKSELQQGGDSEVNKLPEGVLGDTAEGPAESINTPAGEKSELDFDAMLSSLLDSSISVNSRNGVNKTIDNAIGLSNFVLTEPRNIPNNSSSAKDGLACESDLKQSNVNKTHDVLADGKEHTENQGSSFIAIDKRSIQEKKPVLVTEHVSKNLETKPGGSLYQEESSLYSGSD